LKCLLEKRSELSPETFDASPETLDFLQNSLRILVLGAGGLGCELLKDLAFSGFGNIDIIDMDTIDLSNLNRQFLFRKKDIGKSKAVVAAEFINNRIPSCKVVAHYCKIQDYPEDWYQQFHLVVCGLDSIVARRWINQTLVSLLNYTVDGLDEDSIIPLVDGGTEGFLGNMRVVLPGKSACIECGLNLFPPQVTYPMCTLANTPRLPEHCIEFVKLSLWPQESPYQDQAVDGDNTQHVSWIYEKSLHRALKFGITGVTFRLTQGVIKNIIPTVASTNAIIGAALATECLKLATHCAQALDNYRFFNDTDGIYTSSFMLEKRDDCVVCSQLDLEIQLCSSQTLGSVLESFMEGEYQMSAPGLRLCTGVDDARSLYLQSPPSVEAKLLPNLAKTLQELGIENGMKLMVVDKTNPNPIIFNVKMSDAMVS